MIRKVRYYIMGEEIEIGSRWLFRSAELLPVEVTVACIDKLNNVHYDYDDGTAGVMFITIFVEQYELIVEDVKIIIDTNGEIPADTIDKIIEGINKASDRNFVINNGINNIDPIEIAEDIIKEAKKFDTDKTRYELLPPEALEEIAKVLTYGAKKYDDRNWEKGIKYGRLFGACMRHLWAWWAGQDKDPESSISHLAHAACCIMFLIHHQYWKIELASDLDNRPFNKKSECGVKDNG